MAVTRSLFLTYMNSGDKGTNIMTLLKKPSGTQLLKLLHYSIPRGTIHRGHSVNCSPLGSLQSLL